MTPKEYLRQLACKEYKEKWREDISDEELAILATDINGIEFLCDGLTFGWIRPFIKVYIYDTFRRFINGSKKIPHTGYLSSLWIRYEGERGEINVTSTLLAFIDCKCTIIVARHHACRIFVAGNSDITIESEGTCELEVYSDPDNEGYNPKVICNGNVAVTQHTQSKWKGGHHEP